MSDTPVGPKPYGSIKRRHGVSRFYQEHKNDVIQRVDRKHWNRAIALIDAPKEEKDLYCLKTDRSERRIFSSSSHLVTEIRQALLRHDWHSVCRLHQCFLDVGEINHAISNKLMIVQLLSNPASNFQLIKDFCSMALGMKGEEIEIFHHTICRLPKEIPRGYIRSRKNKLVVENIGGDIEIANSYLNASALDKNNVDDSVE
ncbi:UPF0260 protein [Frankliniella fusca]|uniref:UPF0260 protein n=1 Tax=Frankliniella fusca TaxID=407009 RepID=A0AAE1HW94_9NEOP|nr:UPF0260 protein [Frankliniella fusca]